MLVGRKGIVVIDSSHQILLPRLTVGWGLGSWINGSSFPTSMVEGVDDVLGESMDLCGVHRNGHLNDSSNQKGVGLVCGHI